MIMKKKTRRQKLACTDLMHKNIKKVYIRMPSVSKMLVSEDATSLCSSGIIPICQSGTHYTILGHNLPLQPGGRFRSVYHAVIIYIHN